LFDMDIRLMDGEKGNKVRVWVRVRVMYVLILSKRKNYAYRVTLY
jgi:hypothetical protein